MRRKPRHVLAPLTVIALLAATGAALGDASCDSAPCALGTGAGAATAAPAPGSGAPIPALPPIPPIPSIPPTAPGASASSAATALAASSGATAATAATAAPPPLLLDVDAARVLDAVRAPGAKAVLLNVWATWCLPCREEMPDLVRLDREFRDRGFRLVLVSADFEDQREEAARFLAENGYTAQSYLKRQKDQAFIDGIDPAWGGALPASMLYDGSGKQVALWEGKVTFEELRKKLLELL